MFKCNMEDTHENDNEELIINVWHSRVKGIQSSADFADNIKYYFFSKWYLLVDFEPNHPTNTSECSTDCRKFVLWGICPVCWENPKKKFSEGPLANRIEKCDWLNPRCRRWQLQAMSTVNIILISSVRSSADMPEGVYTKEFR